MNCPFCQNADTKVLDSRPDVEGKSIRRRRECISCNKRWRTIERVEDEMPLVVKKNQSFQPFDRAKLICSIQVSCGKRPVSPTDIEKAVADIEWGLLQTGLRTVTSRELGAQVMAMLKILDEIAYVRYASVYRRFKDASDLMNEVRGLLNDSAAASLEKAFKEDRQNAANNLANNSANNSVNNSEMEKAP